jgi:hypothetical protein
VATQMALVDIQFARGAFADAEDHLWKAIDTAKSAQTLVVGASFYLSLLRLEDAPLEEGGLPRGEVIDALDELYEKIYAASPPDDVWELLLARREVIRDRRADVGEEILERYAGEPVDGRCGGMWRGRGVRWPDRKKRKVAQKRVDIPPLSSLAWLVRARYGRGSADGPET